MKVSSRSISAVVLLAACAVVVVWILGELGVFHRDIIIREKPLRSPVVASSTRDGVITLADGRSFRPAGVRRRSTIEPALYDEALKVMVAQGIEVTRDLGDGRAFLVVEPYFTNSCGTRGRDGTRWAGTYYQCPLSELLVVTGYGEVDLNKPGLSPRERWRLEGWSRVESPSEPRWIGLRSLRWGGSERHLAEGDELLAILGTPPPAD